jgi:aminopeptidase YwaD
MKNIYFPFFAILLILNLSNPATAQDRAYVSEVVKKLSSPGMHGRASYKNGDHIAAKYLSKEMKKAGLTAFTPGYKQEYSYNINTFSTVVDVKADNMQLVPGVDYVVSPSMASLNQTFELVWLPDTLTQPASLYRLIDTTSLAGKMLVVPEGIKNAYRHGIPGVSAMIQTVDGNMWWHVSRKQMNAGFASLKVKKEKLPPATKTISMNIESELIKDRPAYNLSGYVRGSVEPDSFMIFVAHYDHLGRMGRKTYFPGASDNASGSATVLDLARFYAKNKEKAYYTMVFVLVSGEEAGLLGSGYFAENPPFPLEKTKFVINFDMVGTGSEGLSVVNGKVFPEAFALFDVLNIKNKFFPDLRAGGESCNSDHCPFYQKGVPAVFLFTRGKENQNYHNINDTHSELPFTAYEQLFGIVTKFVDELKNMPFFKKEL